MAAPGRIAAKPRNMVWISPVLAFIGADKRRPCGRLKVTVGKKA
jgi:hypothetical protein